MERLIYSGRQHGKTLKVWRDKLDSKTQEELTDLLMEFPGHDQRFHHGKALTQTGLLAGCPRCEILMRYKGAL